MKERTRDFEKVKPVAKVWGEVKFGEWEGHCPPLSCLCPQETFVYFIKEKSQQR